MRSQVHVTATFSGEFMGHTGKGQPLDFWVANAARFAPDGRVAEHWSLGPDAFGVMMTQMGLGQRTLVSGS